MISIKLPTWKAYLYTLKKRIRLFKAVNIRDFKWGLRKYSFQLRPEDGNAIKSVLMRFGEREVFRKVRAFMLLKYCETVESNWFRCSVREKNIALKMYPLLKFINPKEIFMEMAELKKFAKEVGLGLKDIKGHSEEELVTLILKNIDPESNYSDDFVKWYEGLDDEVFEGDNGNKNKEMDIDEIRQAIEDADDIDDLKELLKDYPEVFPKKLSKITDDSELQEAMINVIEGIEETPEPEVEEKKPAKKTSKKQEVKEEVDTSELVEFITSTEDVAELRALCKDESYAEYFGDISLKGRLTAETLKAKMLTALGIEPEVEEEEPEVEEKKPAKKSPAKKQQKSYEEELNEKTIIELRKLAKSLDIGGVKLTSSKDWIIEQIIKSSSTESSEENIEVTPSLVQDMVKAKDLSGLQEIAETMGIKLGAFDKRSPVKMGEKIISALGESEEVAPKEDSGSVYSAIKKMVADGKDEDEIEEKAIKLFKGLGIDKLRAKGKIKVFIEVAALELEKK